MLAVEDDGAVFDFCAGDDLRLDHVEHVAVAVVVVADVLLVEPRHWRDFERSSEVAAIPGDDHVLAVGVDGGPEHEDDVVQDGIDLGVALRRDELVRKLDGMLAAGNFAGVESAIDVNDDLGCAGEFTGLLVGQRAGVGEFAGDGLVFFETREVFRRGDDGDLEVFAAGALADFEHLYAVGTGGEGVKIFDRVVVVGEVEVISGIVAQDRGGGGNLGGSGYESKGDKKDKEGAAAHSCPLSDVNGCFIVASRRQIGKGF